MRALVTGADGFMGSHLVDALLAWEGCEHVTALAHRLPLKWLPHAFSDLMTVRVGDITSRAQVESMPEVDAVFHLAAIPSSSRCEEAPDEAHWTNFQGTVNLLNRALEMRPHPVFVHVSTAALYGEPQYLPIDERHPVVPRDAYTSTKLSAELTVVAYSREQGLPGVIVRPFNVYGPRQDAEYVVPTIVLQCLKGEEVRLGDGRPVRNFTFVTDAVNLLLRAAMFPRARGKVINLGSREALPIFRIADMAVDMTGCGLEPIYDIERFRRDEPTVLEMDPSLAEELLEWRPRISLPEGLRLTIDRFRSEGEERLLREADRMLDAR